MEARLRYSIDQYDKHGFLKAPKWLWLGWMLLAKDWIVFVIAGVSRENGSKLLSLFYPNQELLYFGLLMGTPSLLLMWLIGLRQPERQWVNRLVSWGKGITLLLATAQLSQTLYNVAITHGHFHWTNAATIVLLSWFILYLCQSKTVRTCFQIPQWDK